MTKAILLTAFAFFLTCSTASSDSYLIQTKDGEEFETSQYWEDGGEIKFEVDQGIMGIPVGDVKQIKKIEGRRKSRSFQRVPDGAASEVAPPNPGENSLNGSSNQATSDTPSDTAMYQKFDLDVTAFQKRVFQQINTLSKKELLAVAADGVTLKERLLKTNQIQQLNPLLRKLDNTLDMLENAINEAH